MKNIFLFVTVIMLAFVANTADAQKYEWLWKGAVTDTIDKSETVYKVVNVNGNDLQTVSVQISLDTLSGSPKVATTLYKSLDGLNWVISGSAVTWHGSVDTTFIITDTAFYGAYAKVTMVATSTTQKSQYSGVLKAWKND